MYCLLPAGQAPRKLRSLASSPASPPEFAWWVEINTSVPRCTYYFGPFDSRKQARESRSAYVDDLCREQARGIVALVKQCQPSHLTRDRGYDLVGAQDCWTIVIQI